MAKKGEEDTFRKILTDELALRELEDTEQRETEARSMMEDIEEFEHRIGLRMTNEDRLSQKKYALRKQEDNEELRRIGVRPAIPARKESVSQFFEYSSPRVVPATAKHAPNKNHGSGTAPVKSYKDVQIVTARSTQSTGTAAAGAAASSRAVAPGSMGATAKLSSTGAGASASAAAGAAGAKPKILASSYYQDPVLMHGRILDEPKQVSTREFRVPYQSSVVETNPFIEESNARPPPPPSAYQKAIDKAKALKQKEVADLRQREVSSIREKKAKTAERGLGIGEPFQLTKQQQIEAERSKPRAREIIPFEPEDYEDMDIAHSLEELDIRSKKIKNAEKAEIFARDSALEDSRRQILTNKYPPAAQSQPRAKTTSISNH